MMQRLSAQRCVQLVALPCHRRSRPQGSANQLQRDVARRTHDLIGRTGSYLSSGVKSRSRHNLARLVFACLQKSSSSMMMKPNLPLP